MFRAVNKTFLKWISSDVYLERFILFYR